MHGCHATDFQAVCSDHPMCFHDNLQLKHRGLTLARYFSSLDTTVNSTSRAGRAMPYATTFTTSREISDPACCK
jgi:hypothetical protein